MAGKEIKRNVWVGGVLYGPDGEQDVPKDVLDQITNEKVFTDPEEAPSAADADDSGDEEPAPKAPAKKAAAKKR